MKVFFKKNGWMIITAIILLIIGPMLIYVFFKAHTPEDTALWTGSDFLLFYGSVLAACGTAIGVFLTVRYAQKNYQEDVRKRVLPYISVTELFVKHRYDPFSDYIRTMQGGTDFREPKEEEYLPVYEEYQLEKLFFLYKDGIFVAMHNLPQEYDDLLKHNGIVCYATGDNTKQYSHKGYMSFPLIVENVGCGPAINLRIGLNKKNEKELFVRPRQLKINQSLYVHIFVPEFDPCEEMEFNCSFVYQDIYKNKYRQDYPITLTNERMSLAYEAEQIQMEDITNG